MSDWLDRIYAHERELVGLVVHASGESERGSASGTFHLGRHAKLRTTPHTILRQSLCTASLKRYQKECLLHQEAERVRRDQALAPHVIRGDEMVARSVEGRK
jgi:hypothetical protein